MMRLNALQVADDLVELLQAHQGLPARAHSVFPHAINLLVCDDVLITVTNQDNITPMGLIVDFKADFRQLFNAEDEIILDVSQLAASNGAFLISTQDAPIWQAGLPRGLVPRERHEVMQITHQLLKWLGSQTPEGLLPLLPRLIHKPAFESKANGNLYTKHIASTLESFTTVFLASDWQSASTLADKLIGFGMGSTPSCDDFLAACMVVLRIADEVFPGRFRWVREFNHLIAENAKNRTTLVSANLLRHAAEGKVSLCHQQLIEACLFKSDHDLIRLADKVLRQGASSGGDFLLGLVCALKWYQEQALELSMEGEKTWVESARFQPVPTL